MMLVMIVCYIFNIFISTRGLMVRLMMVRVVVMMVAVILTTVISYSENYT